MPDGSTRTVRERVWLLREHQLMSVKPESPAVLVTGVQGDHMRMKADKTAGTKDIPRRKLDEFETAALTKLRDGADVVVQTGEQEMRVLGAVRARTDCLKCHAEAKEGTMLGAFTYKLALQSEATRPEDRLKDTAGLSNADLGAVQVVESLGGKVVRTRGGPISEIYFTHTRNRDAKEHFTSGLYVPGGSTMVMLKDSSMRLLGAFPDLSVLDVSFSYVTDAGLKEIAKLTHLKKLNLVGTYVSDAGVAELKKALPGCEIERNPPAVPGATP